MQSYSPTEKPYGIATVSGMMERFKGLLLFVGAEVVCIIGLIITMYSSMTPYIVFKILIIYYGLSIAFASLPIMVLGMVWAYFPEFKPHWRKRLTW